MGMKHTNFPCVICWNRRKTALLNQHPRGSAPAGWLTPFAYGNCFRFSRRRQFPICMPFHGYFHYTSNRQKFQLFIGKLYKKDKIFHFPAVCPRCGHTGGFSFSLDLCFPVCYPISMRHTTTNGRRLHPLFLRGYLFGIAPIL